VTPGSFILALMLAVLVIEAVSASPVARQPLEPLTVHLELLEQTTCRIDEQRSLASWAMRAVFVNHSDRVVALLPGRSRVVEASLVAASEDDGSGARFVALATSEPLGLPGAVAHLAPGWAASGSTMVWLPVRRESAGARDALGPGSYRARFRLSVPLESGGVNRHDVTLITAPLVVIIPAPHQEQECGDAARALIRME
jgi:hypothetical protein